MTTEAGLVPDQPMALEVNGAEVTIAEPRAPTDESRSFLYVDCGAWMGDGRHLAAQRSFAVACGDQVALCEFQAGRAAPSPQHDGAAAQPIARALTALAGPQRMDVTVRRWAVARASRDAHDDGSSAVDQDRVIVFLPDMHLPLVGRMPDLDPDLVPDPRLAKCWCHGPIFARIDQEAAAKGQKPVYRAVGSRLTRSPNDWFYAMAASYQSAAEDLVRFLDRYTRYAASAPAHLVQLGGMFDVWAGYKCLFHSMGFAGLVEPRIVAGAGEREFAARWRDATLDGRVKDAIGRLYRIPVGRRTLLSAPHGHAGAPPSDEPPWLRASSVFAENRPEPIDCVDQPPHALVGMIEGKAQFFPWKRVRPAGFRRELVAAAARRFRDEPFAAYVMAHTHVPCLAEVTVT